MRGVAHSAQIDREHAVPILGIEVLDAVPAERPRIVQEDVDTPEALHYRIDGLSDLVEVGNVDRLDDHVVMTLVFQVRGHGFQSGGVDVP